MIKFRDAIFQRLFALVALFAGLGIFLELKGLFLKNGIVPFFNLQKQIYGLQGFWKLPSLFVFNASDFFIYLILGVMMAALLALASDSIRNRFVRAALVFVFYITYISFVNFGSPFMSFQWDALILETAFLLCVYLFLSQDDELAKINIWLFRILVFKLMLMSGLVKLFSGDKVWLDFSALKYHYFTQPLPNPLAFFIHQLPSWFHKLSCVLMFVIELVLPFFIFCGKKLREIAAWVFIALMLIIFLTGNYGFFNLLTMVLCFSLLDFETRETKTFSLHKSFKIISIVILTLYSLVSLSLIFSRTPVAKFFSAPVHIYYKTLGHFHICNPYGLFARMTKKRGEIVIQGAKLVPGQKTIDWKDYQFKYKPQDLRLFPMQIAPLQPRLDWQMWFAALSNYKQNPWFMNLVARLLQNDKDVVALLKENPFAGSNSNSGPDLIRAVYYDYTFNDFTKFKKTKEPWQRKYRGVYLPEISLKK